MLAVENLKKQHPPFERRPGGGAVGVSFTIQTGELFTLLGPSGCGKTTTLRAIAGLEKPETGRIVLEKRELFNAATSIDVAPSERDIGMVFQSYAIWPHMSVFENAAYPLRVSRKPRASRADMQRKVMATLEMVGLSSLARRSATQLSGGQQQRLALARAFTREPRLLLLDEPLSNLDAQLRDQMRGELKRLQRESGITAIYVTHDQSEALAISDRVAVMQDGRIVQLGTPKDIYARPASEFVASFIGRSNLLRGKLLTNAAKNGIAPVMTGFGRILGLFPAATPAGTDATLLVRPEHIAVASDADALRANSLLGTVKRETYLGEIVEYVVAVEGGEIIMRMPDRLDVSAGDAVTVIFPPDKAVALIAG